VDLRRSQRRRHGDSRIGIEASAEAVTPGTDLAPHIARLRGDGINILVIDEAQFASVGQIDALAQIVDDLGIDVHAFGLSATSSLISSRVRRGSSPSRTGPTNCP